MTIELVRDGLRLSKAHRHFGHGFRDDAHVLRAGEHVREHEKEKYRHDQNGGERNDGGKADTRRRKKTAHLRAVERGNGEAANDPDETTYRGGDIRRAGGTMAQGLQDLPNTGPVIIGGTAWRALAERPGLRRILRKEFGGGGHRG